MGCSDAIQTVKNLLYGPVQRLRSPVYLLPRLRTIRFRHALSTHYWFHISTSDSLNCTTPPHQSRSVREGVVRGTFMPSYCLNNSTDLPIYLSNSLNNQARFIWRGYIALNVAATHPILPHRNGSPLEHPFKFRSFIATT